MSFFHSHCKECGKAISWGWDYCSLSCESAEYSRQKELYRLARIGKESELKKSKIKEMKK